jgi:hypothetical protein
VFIRGSDFSLSVAKFLRAFVVKKSFLKSVSIRVNPWLNFSSTNDQRLSTNDSLSAKRAGIHNQIPKKIKKFSDSLTPYPTTTYLFSVSSVTSVANVFFVPNAQLRPIVERRCFSAPRSVCTEFLLSYSEFCILFLWIRL